LTPERERTRQKQKKSRPLSLSFLAFLFFRSKEPLFYSMLEFKKAVKSSGDPSSTPSMAPTVFVTKIPKTKAATTTPAAEAGERLRAASTGLAAVAAVPSRTEK